MVITLAWMSVQMSATLAALLTAFLLPWALLKVRRSATLAGMTLAMLGMLWRGEAWKMVYLRVANQPCQSLQQPPKTASFCRGGSSECAGDHCVPQRALVQFLAATSACGYRKPLEPMKSQRASRVASGESCNIPPTAPETDQSAYLARSQPLFLQTDYTLVADPQNTDFSRSNPELPYRIGGNTP
jgi:hypothetical protein